MCEFITSIKASEWIAIVSALIAAYSAWMLNQTYKNQKKSSELQNENLVMERKAIELNFIPTLNNHNIQIIQPHASVQNAYAGFDEVLNLSLPIRVKYTLTVQKNPITIIESYVKPLFANLDTINEELTDYMIFENNFNETILNSGNTIILEVEFDTHEVFNIDTSLPVDDQNQIYDNAINNLCIQFKILLEDGIGNRYFLIVRKQMNNATNIIEYKKASN